MPSTTEILRNACAANGLGTSGSSSVLLARLANASKKKPTNTKTMKPATQIKKATCNGSRCIGKSNVESNGKRKVGRPLGSKNKPKSVVKDTLPVNATKSGGFRHPQRSGAMALSARKFRLQTTIVVPDAMISNIRVDMWSPFSEEVNHSFVWRMVRVYVLNGRNPP